MINKLLLLIVEGKSDEDTLYSPTKNYISSKSFKIKTIITRGDIALKKESTFEACLKEIKNIIHQFKTEYKIKSDDFFGIYHIIDTDGAFCSNTTNKFLVNKSNIYKALYSINYVIDIPYKVLFFSRNLEHALYGEKYINCDQIDKEVLSKEFKDNYKDNAEAFYKLMEEKRGLVPNKYFESWDYICNDSNSLNAGENYIILLDELKNCWVKTFIEETRYEEILERENIKRKF